MTDRQTSDTAGSRSNAVLLLVVVVVAIAVMTSIGNQPKERRPVADVDLTELVASTTRAQLPRAPLDTDPTGTTDGTVVHPRRVLPVYATPGRKPFAKVTPKQMNDTWLPVIDQQRGWTQVLLPSRPNGSVGWLRTAQLVERRTPYVVRVHLGSRQLELVRDGETVGEWSVAVGAPATPTPTGRTFLLGSIVDDAQGFSPVILPLGTHSDTLDTYGGGPGTVALHGWTDPSVFGKAVSHGCVRVPDDALDHLRDVPLGTLVIIDQQ
jgi:lipoprotein-anchoring transpeptidase ErfK/SrfK